MPEIPREPDFWTVLLLLLAFWSLSDCFLLGNPVHCMPVTTLAIAWKSVATTLYSSYPLLGLCGLSKAAQREERRQEPDRGGDKERERARENNRESEKKIKQAKRTHTHTQIHRNNQDEEAQALGGGSILSTVAERSTVWCNWEKGGTFSWQRRSVYDDRSREDEDRLRHGQREAEGCRGVESWPVCSMPSAKHESAREPWCAWRRTSCDLQPRHRRLRWDRGAPMEPGTCLFSLVLSPSRSPAPPKVLDGGSIEWKSLQLTAFFAESLPNPSQRPCPGNTVHDLGECQPPLVNPTLHMQRVRVHPRHTFARAHTHTCSHIAHTVGTTQQASKHTHTYIYRERETHWEKKDAITRWCVKPKGLDRATHPEWSVCESSGACFWHTGSRTPARMRGSIGPQRCYNEATVMTERTETNLSMAANKFLGWICRWAV